MSQATISGASGADGHSEQYPNAWRLLVLLSDLNHVTFSSKFLFGVAQTYLSGRTSAP